MSSTFEYTYVTPKSEHAKCLNSGCYCFAGKSQFNDDMSSISSAVTEPIDPHYFPVLEPHSRDRTLSYESNNDNTLMECEICNSLREDDEVKYCKSCESNCCELCRKDMIADGGLDCGDLKEFLCPTCYKESRRHIFFDENGGEISRESFLQQNEDEEWGFLVPTITRGVLRHPRVLLNFLRYIDSHNEVALSGEQIFLKSIPRHIYDRMLNHSSIQNPSIGFESDVSELIQRIDYHRDLSD